MGCINAQNWDLGSGLGVGVEEGGGVEWSGWQEWDKTQTIT